MNSIFPFLCTLNTKMFFVCFSCVICKNSTSVFIPHPVYVYERTCWNMLASGCLLWMEVLAGCCWLSSIFFYMFCKCLQASCQNHYVSVCCVFSCAMSEDFLISCSHFHNRPTLFTLFVLCGNLCASCILWVTYILHFLSILTVCVSPGLLPHKIPTKT